MDLQLLGKHALVCGGSQGIGRASAHELAALGADVTLLARSADALEIALADLPRIHSAQKHGFIVADMQAHATLRAQVEAVANNGAINILVNNSGGKISTSKQIRRLNYPSTEYSTNAEAVATATHTLNSESSNPTGDNGGTSVWWDKNPRL